MTQPPDDPTTRPTASAGPASAGARASFSPADPAPPTRRIRRRHLFGLLALTLLVVSGALVLAAFLLRPSPPKHCTALFDCGGPVARGAVHSGTIYKSRKFGFQVEYGPNSGLQKSPDGIIVSYSGPTTDEQGQVEVVGLRSGNTSASDVVSSVAQQIAPDATEVYEVPNPYIGGIPAVGEAYDVEADGSSDSNSLDRLIVLAAVRGDLAIAVVDMGPYWQFSSSNTAVMNLNDHPSPADQYAALFADPMVNSVVWPAGGG
ncbi:MAG: hypothetical protein ACRDXC_13435 [Acidimicrobiales bacterium]